jgi:lipoprotein-anchoring transpeptidase ErfK/SrfK
MPADAQPAVVENEAQPETPVPRPVPPPAQSAPVADAAEPARSTTGLIPADCFKTYKIRKGDCYSLIAQRSSTTTPLLMKLNNSTNTKLRTGREMKIVEGPFRVEVELNAYTLSLVLGDRVVKTYSIGIGSEDEPTPTGSFTVTSKKKNPACVNPRRRFAADDPANPLGERWIGFSGQYGIHGTIDPDSIGKRSTLGCIRMLPGDVEELYDFLRAGASEVVIK